jgi:hypothetical protein
MQISWLDSVQRRAGPLALKENAPELQKVRAGEKEKESRRVHTHADTGNRRAYRIRATGRLLLLPGSFSGLSVPEATSLIVLAASARRADSPPLPPRWLPV